MGLLVRDGRSTFILGRGSVVDAGCGVSGSVRDESWRGGMRWYSLEEKGGGALVWALTALTGVGKTLVP
jgi:hypothetical protein